MRFSFILLSALVVFIEMPSSVISPLPALLIPILANVAPIVLPIVIQAGTEVIKEVPVKTLLKLPMKVGAGQVAEFTKKKKEKSFNKQALYDVNPDDGSLTLKPEIAKLAKKERKKLKKELKEEDLKNPDIQRYLNPPTDFSSVVGTGVKTATSLVGTVTKVLPIGGILKGGGGLLKGILRKR